VLLLAWPLAPGRAAAQVGSTQAKPEFVEHLLRFVEAAAGTYGDEAAPLEAHLEGMRQALARWDRELAIAEADVAGLSGAGTVARAAFGRALSIQLLDRGRLADAERALAEALRLDRPHADVWQLLGAMRSRLGRADAAIDALEEAARLEPGAPTTWYLLAEQSRRAGDTKTLARARESFERTAREQLARQTSSGEAPAAPFLDWGLLQEPVDARPYFLPAAYADGLALLRQGEHAGALASFEAAVAADPLVAVGDATRDRLAVAGSALRRGDLPAALRELEALVADEPGAAEAYRIMGNAFRAAGRHAESLAALETAVRLQPASDRARVARAEVLQAGGRTREAAEALRETIALAPAAGLAHYRLGEASTRLRTYESARAAFAGAIAVRPLVGTDTIHRAMAELPRAADTDDEAAVETQRRRVALDLNNVGARVALGTASLELGDNAGAVMELLAALLIDPGHVEANAALAQASLRLDDHAGAVVAARRALEGHPNHPGAQYVLATALTRQGNAEEAALAFERYRRMLDDAQVARRRDFELDRLLVDAREHATRGAIDEAVASLRAGMALRPEDPALPLSVGLLLLNGQRPQEAIAALEAALALGAGPEAHQHLAAAYDPLGRPEDARRHQETFERSLVRAPRP
jgi:tetratricopeptide (TPR) repeat protein